MSIAAGATPRRPRRLRPHFPIRCRSRCCLRSVPEQRNRRFAFGRESIVWRRDAHRFPVPVLVAPRGKPSGWRRVLHAAFEELRSRVLNLERTHELTNKQRMMSRFIRKFSERNHGRDGFYVTALSPNIQKCHTFEDKIPLHSHR